MNKEQAQELYSAYIEDDLTPVTRSSFEIFLKENEDVRQEFQDFEKTLNSLRGLANVNPPPEFGRKIERRIRRRSKGRFFAKQDLPLFFRIPFEWISFVIILLLLALYITTVLEKPKTPTTQPEKNHEQPIKEMKLK